MTIRTNLSIDTLIDTIWEEMTNQYPEYNFIVFANGDTLALGENEIYTGTQPILYRGSYCFPEAFEEFGIADEDGYIKDDLTDEEIDNFKKYFIGQELVKYEGYRGDLNSSELEEIIWDSEEEDDYYKD